MAILDMIFQIKNNGNIKYDIPNQRTVWCQFESTQRVIMHNTSIIVTITFAYICTRYIAFIWHAYQCVFSSQWVPFDSHTYITSPLLVIHFCCSRVTLQLFNIVIYLAIIV